MDYSSPTFAPDDPSALSTSPTAPDVEVAASVEPPNGVLLIWASPDARPRGVLPSKLPFPLMEAGGCVCAGLVGSGGTVALPDPFISVLGGTALFGVLDLPSTSERVSVCEFG